MCCYRILSDRSTRWASDGVMGANPAARRRPYRARRWGERRYRTSHRLRQFAEAQAVAERWRNWSVIAFILTWFERDVRREHNIVQAVELADKLDIPLVATNDVRFSRENFESHEIRVCILRPNPCRSRRARNYSESSTFGHRKKWRKCFRTFPTLENSVIARRLVSCVIRDVPARLRSTRRIRPLVCSSL